jgi:hypothetical protein
LEFTTPRLALSGILRRVSPGIIKRIVEEAARASGASADDLRAYEAMMLAMTPPVLDAIAADDKARADLLVTLAIEQSEGAIAVPSVPPVARVGLLEIGIRLGRQEIVAATRGRTDAEEIIHEFEVLADQLRLATRIGMRSEQQQPR